MMPLFSFLSLQEGSVLLLRNFIVKPRFQMPEHPLWRPPGLPWYDVDINVNAHHPTGEVTVLESAVVEDLLDVRLPLPVANFVTRRQLRCVGLSSFCFNNNKKIWCGLSFLFVYLQVKTIQMLFVRGVSATEVEC